MIGNSVVGANEIKDLKMIIHSEMGILLLELNSLQASYSDEMNPKIITNCTIIQQGFA